MTAKPRDARLRWERLDRLRETPGNPRQHDLDAIAASLRRFGVVAPVVVGGDGRILAGHGRVAALRRMDAGGQEPPLGVRVVGGTWRIQVLDGIGLAGHEAAAYLVADNRTQERGGWDSAALATMLRELEAVPDVGLLGTGYAAGELADLEALVTAAAVPRKPKGDPEAIPEPRPKPTLEAGDLLALGDHRLLVGDSTIAAEVERLMAGERAAMVLEDPPFGIYGSSTGLGSDVSDDKMIRSFCRDVLATAESVVRLFGHVYVHCDWRSWPSWWDASRLTHLEPKNLVIWDKGGSGLGNNYANTYEGVGFFCFAPPQKIMRGSEATGQRPVLRPNVFRAKRPYGDDRLHNAAKPVELLAELISNSSDPGELVVDLFAGSGSTLIAAEQTGRRCVTMEIDPAWAQVALDRWERYTGKKARKLRR